MDYGGFGRDESAKISCGSANVLEVQEPEFYSDSVYTLKKIVGSSNFSAQFIKLISHYKKIGYCINVLQQTACLVVNPIAFGNFCFPLYLHASGSDFRVYDGSDFNT